MRAFLLVALAIVCGLAPPARAQLTLRGNYWRDRNTRVLAPDAELSKELPSGTIVTAGYLLDAITSASASAGVTSDQPFTELRNQIHFAVTQRIGNFTLGGSYRYSTESDYWAHVFGLNAGGELNEKNTLLNASLFYTHADVGARSGPTSYTPVGRLESKLLLLSASQILTRHLVVDGLVELADEGGDDNIDAAYCGDPNHPDHKSERQCLPEFLSNPYRTVILDASPVREQEPGERKRLSITGLARYSIMRPGAFDYIVFAGKYRFYADDWGVVSHAPELRTYVGVGPLEFRLTGRYYTQSAADFFKFNTAQDKPFYFSPTSAHVTDAFKSVEAQCWKNGALEAVGADVGCTGGRIVYSGDAKVSAFSSSFLELRVQVKLGFLDVPWLPLGHWLGDGLLAISYGHYFTSAYAFVQYGNAEVGGLEMIFPL